MPRRSTYQKDPAKYKRRSIAWQRANPAKARAANARYNATPAAKKRKARYHENNPRAKRAETLKRLYGMTLADEDRLRVAQGDRCATCDVSLENSFVRCVDHDHTTGRVRGLLCRRCNMAIGLLGESVERVRRVVAYLDLRGPRS